MIAGSGFGDVGDSAQFDMLLLEGCDTAKRCERLINECEYPLHSE
jgi:hypothetical protein